MIGPRGRSSAAGWRSCRARSIARAGRREPRTRCCAVMPASGRTSRCPKTSSSPRWSRAAGPGASSECSALSASWLHDYPDSERRQQVDARLRQMQRTSPASASAARSHRVSVRHMPRSRAVRPTPPCPSSGQLGHGPVSAPTTTTRCRSRPSGSSFSGITATERRCREARRRAAGMIGFAYQPAARGAAATAPEWRAPGASSPQ